MPVRPTNAAIPRRSAERPAEHLTNQPRRRFQPHPADRHQQADHRHSPVGIGRGELRHARRIDLRDLFARHAVPLHQAPQLGHRLRRQRRAGASPQFLQLLRRLLQARPEVANAVQAQQTLDLVLEPDALAHQLVALATRPPRILLLDAGNAHHRAHPRLPAQPGQQRPQQHVQIDAIGFGSPPLALDGDARRLHHMRLDPSATQLARDPEPVPPRLVSHNYARDRLASPDRLRLPAIHHTHDFVHVTRLHARLRPPRDAGNHRSQLPGLPAQFHRHHQRAIVIEGGRGAVRIEKIQSSDRSIP